MLATDLMAVGLTLSRRAPGAISAYMGSSAASTFVGGGSDDCAAPCDRVRLAKHVMVSLAALCDSDPSGWSNPQNERIRSVMEDWRYEKQPTVTNWVQFSLATLQGEMENICLRLADAERAHRR